MVFNGNMRIRYDRILKSLVLVLTIALSIIVILNQVLLTKYIEYRKDDTLSDLEKLSFQAQKHKYSSLLKQKSLLLANQLNGEMSRLLAIRLASRFVRSNRDKLVNINEAIEKKQLLYQKLSFNPENELIFSEKEGLQFGFAETLIWKRLFKQEGGRFSIKKDVLQLTKESALIKLLIPLAVDKRYSAISYLYEDGAEGADFSFAFPSIRKEKNDTYPGFTLTSGGSFFFPSVMSFWASQREYGIDKPQFIVTPFYQDAVSGKFNWSFALPLYSETNKNYLGKLFADIQLENFEEKFTNLLRVEDGVMLWRNGLGQIFSRGKIEELLYLPEKIRLFSLPKVFNRVIFQRSLSDSSNQKIKEMSCKEDWIELADRKTYLQLCEKLKINFPNYFLSSSGVLQSEFYLSYFVPKEKLIPTQSPFASASEKSFENRLLILLIGYFFLLLGVLFLTYYLFRKINLNIYKSIRASLLLAYKGKPIPLFIQLPENISLILNKTNERFQGFLETKRRQERILDRIKDNKLKLSETLNQTLNRFSFGEFRLYEQAQIPLRIRLTEIVYSLNSEFRFALDELFIAEYFKKEELKSQRQDFNFYFFLQNYFEFLRLYRAQRPFKIENHLTFDDNLWVHKEYLQYFLLSLFRKINLFLFFDAVIFQAEEQKEYYFLNIHFQGIQSSELLTYISANSNLLDFLINNIKKTAISKRRFLEKVDSSFEVSRSDKELILKLRIAKFNPPSEVSAQKRFIHFLSEENFSSRLFKEYLPFPLSEYDVLVISDQNYQQVFSGDVQEYDFNKLSSYLNDRSEQKRSLILYESISQFKDTLKDFTKLGDRKFYPYAELVHMDSNYFHKMRFQDYKQELQNELTLLPIRKETFLSKILNQILIYQNSRNFELVERIHLLEPCFEDFETNSLRVNELVKEFFQFVSINLGTRKEFGIENQQYGEKVWLSEDRKSFFAQLEHLNNGIHFSWDTPINPLSKEFLTYLGQQFVFFEREVFNVSNNRKNLSLIQKILRRFDSLICIKKIRSNKVEVYFADEERNLSKNIYPIPFELLAYYLKSKLSELNSSYLFKNELIHFFTKNVNEKDFKKVFI